MATILIIEDDLLLSELYSDVLQTAGYKVHKVRSAQEGIELIDEHKIDVIVLDILLPNHNGIGLLHELRSYSDLAKIPVIIHSALDPGQFNLPKSAWQEYGVADYIYKVSSRPQDLVRAVRRLVAP